MLTHDEEKMISVVVGALEGYKEMTDALSGEQDVTISAVLPMVASLEAPKYKPLKHNASWEIRNDIYDYVKEKLVFFFVLGQFFC